MKPNSGLLKEMSLVMEDAIDRARIEGARRFQAAAVHAIGQLWFQVPTAAAQELLRLVADRLDDIDLTELAMREMPGLPPTVPAKSSGGLNGSSGS